MQKTAVNAKKAKCDQPSDGPTIRPTDMASRARDQKVILIADLDLSNTTNMIINIIVDNDFSTPTHYVFCMIVHSHFCCNSASSAFLTSRRAGYKSIQSRMCVTVTN